MVISKCNSIYIRCSNEQVSVGLTIYFIIYVTRLHLVLNLRCAVGKLVHGIQKTRVAQMQLNIFSCYFVTKKDFINVSLLMLTEL